jgi:hypothetical protein
MPKLAQQLLLALGIVALITLGVEIVLSVAATQHGATPAKVVQVNAGPYPLTVSYYTYPAQAGFALPFAIAPQHSIAGALTYSVTSLPAPGMHATPVRASLAPNAHTPNGVQGAAEITVRGQWYLAITVSGPQGQGVAYAPVTATALPAIPGWLGWLIGMLPLYGLIAFFIIQRDRVRQRRIASE